jgi:membrane protease YdiL (CAAX protease family)
MSALPTTERPAQPPQKDRDGLPLWVIVLGLVFLALRVFDLTGGGSVFKGGRVSQTMTGAMDSKTMAAMMATNLLAKQAFVASLVRPGDDAPDAASLREALKSAEDLQKGSGNAPSTARRVIILRGLLHRPLFGKGKNGLDPKAAFTASALADLPVEDRRRYAAEGQLWVDAARGPHLSPAQTDAEAAQLRAIPNIRWWRSPGLAVLYESQGNPAEARKYERMARRQALATTGPLTAMELLYGVLGMGGFALLAYLAIQRRPKLTPDLPPDPWAPGLPQAQPWPDPWPTMPEMVSLDERRLRAGDLMGVFVVYLMMPDMLGWLLGGFHVRHLVYFQGFLAPLKHKLLTAPAGAHVAALVVLEFFAYLISAAIPIGLLLLIASRKRASVGEELGWNTHRLGKNLLYGVGGYAIALPLVLLASAAGPHLFRGAPAPSNPAIPLLANASSIWVQALLTLLATVAAPLTEEFLFRGVFYNAAKLRVGVWPAIILTGLIFGFVHPVGIAEMLPLAVLGGVFAWMAETRKSLAPSILAHCLQNTFATLMLLLALGG